MKIQETKNGNTLVLNLAGELDLTGAPELTAYLEGRLGEPDGLELNLKEITYLSSAGIRAILAAHRAMGGREFRVTGCNDLVYEVFEVTGLDEVLTIEKA